MKLAIRLSTMMILTTVTATRAMAVDYSRTGIVSGATLVFAGSAATNVNILKLNYGSGFVIDSGGTNVVHIDITGNYNIITRTVGGSTANTVFCTDATAQGSNKVYYVYYAGYGTNYTTGFSVVVSTSPPTSEGRPGTALSFTVGVNTVTTSYTAVFVGSYVTNGASDVVPFLRQGDDVILEPQDDAFGNAGYPGGTFQAQFPSTDTFPEVKPLTVVTGMLIPGSASAILVDSVVGTNQVAPWTAEYAILDPTYNTIDSAAGHCKFYPQTEAICNDKTYTCFTSRIPLAVSSTNKLYVGACTAPAAGKNFTVTLWQVGYRETVHHMF